MTTRRVDGYQVGLGGPLFVASGADTGEPGSSVMLSGALFMARGIDVASPGACVMLLGGLFGAFGELDSTVIQEKHMRAVMLSGMLTHTRGAVDFALASFPIYYQSAGQIVQAGSAEGQIVQAGSAQGQIAQSGGNDA